jgi:hypothetical protein
MTMAEYKATMKRTHFSCFQVSLGFVAVFLTILGAKWALVHGFGSDLPYWDQWYAEGHLLYVPYLGKSLSWSALFAPANEHRVFFSRVLSLALLSLNGQWDGCLQAVVNALLHTSVVVATCVVVWHACGKRFVGLIWILALSTTALPFSYENTLWGFQSCFYFLLGAGVLTIWLLSVYRPFSWHWYAGCFCAICGLFTMGSGVLAPAAVVALLGLRSLRAPSRLKESLATILFCLGVTAAGVALLGHAGGDPTVRAATLSDFVVAFSKALAWPYVTVPWAALVAWLPVAVLAVAFVRGKTANDRGFRVLLGMGLWVVLQAAGMAFTRGAGGQRPASRYMDILSLGTFANGVAVTIIMHDLVHPQYRKLGKLLAAVWCLWLAVGLGVAAGYVWQYSLPKYRSERNIQMENVRAFVQTDDISFLKGGSSRSIPNSSPDALAFYLRNGAIRSILPVSVREPLRITRGSGTDGGFVIDGIDAATGSAPTERAWGSYGAEGARTRGIFQSVALRKGSLPYLQFEVAGFLGARGTSLELRADDGERALVIPEASGGERWRKAVVRRPKGVSAVVAKDESDLVWFAFREPREMGSLSLWSSALASRGVWIFLLGLGALLSVYGVTALGGRRSTRRGDRADARREQHDKEHSVGYRFFRSHRIRGRPALSHARLESGGRG